MEEQAKMKRRVEAKRRCCSANMASLLLLAAKPQLTQSDISKPISSIPIKKPVLENSSNSFSAQQTKHQTACLSTALAKAKHLSQNKILAAEQGPPRQQDKKKWRLQVSMTSKQKTYCVSYFKQDNVDEFHFQFLLDTAFTQHIFAR